MKKFYLNEREGMICGVCQGLSEYYEVDVMLIRILFLFCQPLATMYFVLAIFGTEKPLEEDSK